MIKIYLKVVPLVVVCLSISTFIAPALISSKSDLGVMVGFGFLLLMPVIGFILSRILFRSLNKVSK